MVEHIFATLFRGEGHRRLRQPCGFFLLLASLLLLCLLLSPGKIEFAQQQNENVDQNDYPYHAHHALEE